MASRALGLRLAARRIAFGALALTLPVTLTFSIGGVAAEPGNGAATIDGSFADSCRAFTAQSSKDISHVEIHYTDGRVVKDETMTTPDYAIDGSTGDEIEFAVVKSGTARETFPCPRANRPPTAALEIKTPECGIPSDDGIVLCDGRTPRIQWTQSTTSLGYGVVRFFCGWPDDQSCVDHVMPCGQQEFYSLCRITYRFRGTSSTDPEGDIVSWSIDFGDGTSTGGDWTTNPPTEISHEYQRWHCPLCEFEPATLTVTDSAGQSAFDAQLPLHDYPE